MNGRNGRTFRINTISHRIRTFIVVDGYGTDYRPTHSVWRIGQDAHGTTSSEEYVMACHLAYSWNVYERNVLRECVDCDELIDVKGHHNLIRGKYGGWTARHDEIRDVLYQWAVRGNIDVVREK